MIYPCPKQLLGTFIKQTVHVLHLTQLYNILLFYHYWLLVLATLDHHQANIYKKFKISVAYSTKSQFYGIPFTFINCLYNFYHLIDVLSVVSCAEIL